jgi:hypothetical protein
MIQPLGLVAALTWPLPMIVALLMTVRERGLRFRVMWALMCFVGVGAFWMQGSTGRWGFIPLAINILGPGFQAGFYKATVPAGAFVVIALLLLRAQKRAQASQQA